MSDEAADGSKVRVSPLDGGKLTLYIWADGLIELLDGDDPLLVLCSKSSIIKLDEQLTATEEAAKDFDMVDRLRQEGNLYVLYESDAVETPEAKALKAVYDTRKKRWKERKEESKKKGEEGDGEAGDSDNDDDWWWELDVVRERPGNGSPCLEAKLQTVTTGWPPKEEGTWWVVGFRVSDKEGRKVMERFGDWVTQIAEFF